MTADWETLTVSFRLDGTLTDFGENIQIREFSAANEKPRASLKANASYSEIVEQRE